MGLTQSHSEQKSKKKKKRKKKKKHKKKKEKKKAVVAAVFVEEHTKQNEDKMEVETEAHDIDVTVHNGGNMGFDDAELNEEHIVLESSKDIELTKDEVTATMNDLEMELMKHNEEKQDNVVEQPEDNTKTVDLSFMDVMSGSNNDNKNEDVVDILNENEIVG